jgi:N-acetylmuramoyl-L-alanine amidase
MSTIIERFLLPLFFVMSILYAFNSLGNNSIILHKAFHHGINDESYIERGTLSFYFSSTPVITEMPANLLPSGEMSYTSFFLPHVVVSSECDAIIKNINNQHGAYSVTIVKTMQPENGIVVTFGCDKKKMAISYDIFDSIGLQKGVAFHIHNKELINILQEKNNQPLLRTLWHSGSKPVIGIDPGHGGADSGTIGCYGIKEKDVCLAVSKYVAQLLQDNGYSVILTRNDDVNLLLSDRTWCANTHHVDLFVSIHANFSFNAQAQGIETFYISPHILKQCYTSLSDNEAYIVKLALKEKYKKSYNLAQLIQNCLCEKVTQNFQAPVNRKVKFSVSQVVLGTQMPCVLIEMGFLSHENESRLLNAENYQKTLAQGIFQGIVLYLSS